MQTVDLDHTTDLQAAVEAAYEADPTHDVALVGTYRVRRPVNSLLHIRPRLSGLRLVGQGARRRAVLHGGHLASHVVTVEDADVRIEDLEITGGDTTSPRRVGREYRGPAGQSLYASADGCGVLILGEANVQIVGCDIRDNHSGMCGGGLSNQSTGSVEVVASRFTGNTAFSTGAAIDNLTPGAELDVQDTEFTDNLSNVGTLTNGPHGQITLFRGTRASVSGSAFRWGSLPIDADRRADVEVQVDGRAVIVRPAGGNRGRWPSLKYRVQIARFERSHARHRLHPVIGPAVPERLGRASRRARVGARR